MADTSLVEHSQRGGAIGHRTLGVAAEQQGGGQGLGHLLQYESVNVTARWYITGTTAGTIATSIEAGIRDGHLEPGARLPTVRALATRLGVSPTTVAAVYRDLGHRGLLSAAGRLGTTVSRRPPVASSWKPVFAPGVRDLASGNPDPALLPDLTRYLRALKVERIVYGRRANDPDLIDLARADLARDGVPPERLTVVGGAMDGLERVLQAHLRPGDRVAVEDPGYPGNLDLLPALGLIPIPVRVDDSGPLPDQVAAVLEAGAEALILTPRAQNPFGAALDRERADQLREVLERHPQVLLIEDDHAAGIAGAPSLTLCSDGRPHWALVRSVSKAFGPDLRLAILCGDATTIARVEGRRLLGTGWVSHILQRLVVSVWTDPATATLLDTASRAYAERRQALIAALLDHGIAAHARSGINVWIPVSDEAYAVAALLDAGWGVIAGERFRTRAPRGIRVSVGSLQKEEARRLAGDLANAFAAAAPARIA
jgi:DNA-binding transcriptional MocR family regulator